MPQKKPKSRLMARVATQNDSHAVIALWRRFMIEEEQAVDNVDIYSAVEKWSWRLDRQIEEEKAFVVEYGDRIVGFACFIGSVNDLDQRRVADENGVPEQTRKGSIPPGVAYVTDIYVSPEGRRSRAAQELFAALLKAVVDGGYKAVWTNTSSRNRRVQRLLQRSGFSTVAGLKIPGLADQIYYEKTLSTA